MKQWFRVFLVSALVVLLTACGGGGVGDVGDVGDVGSGGVSGTVDAIAPVVTLNGDAAISLNFGDTYTEASAIATDNVDGTVPVTTSGTVDTAKVGTYTVTYTAKDVAGNVGTNKRIVTILPATKLKKTGQIVSYTAKDDGDYQTGITPSYTRDDAKEVVTDNVTGLMWQDDDIEASLKPWVTQENYDAKKYSDTSGDTAATYCENLTLGGYDDWRLPSFEELEKIVDYSKFNPAFDSEVFLNLTSNYYWSSTEYKNESFFAWGVDFEFGSGHWNKKSDSFSVVCVRAVQ